jgi:hypothetical protein
VQHRAHAAAEPPGGGGGGDGRAYWFNTKSFEVRLERLPARGGDAGGEPVGLFTDSEADDYVMMIDPRSHYCLHYRRLF